MRKLLIADCSDDYRSALAGALQGSYQVFTCRTGTQARDLLRSERPDILILDLMLPELDGLTLLERAAAEGLHPTVLAVTSIFTDYVSGCFQRLGIEYIIRKPCQISAIAARVQDLCHGLAVPEPPPDPEAFAAERLLALGFSTKHNGFAYLQEGIVRMAQDPSLSVTKALYPAISRTFGCSKENVERSIRTALDRAWERGDAGLWKQYFPDALHRPSNAVFLSRMAEVLRQERE